VYITNRNLSWLVYQLCIKVILANYTFHSRKNTL
jgi:hypothetical protein